MKRLNVSPLLMVSVVVFVVACTGLVWSATYPIQGMRCLAWGSGATCGNAGDMVCRAGGASTCWFCDSSSSIPSFSCGGWEGFVCQWTGEEASVCEGGKSKEGYCANGPNGGDCVVTFTGGVGSCGGNVYAYPCEL